MNEHDAKDNRESTALSPKDFRQRREAARAPWLKKTSISPTLAREAFIQACITPPVFGTADLYPARDLTIDDADADLLLQLIERKLSNLLVDSPTLETVLVELQSQLCGPEPLRAPELRRFLRAEALAIRSRMEQSADQRHEQARHGSSAEVATVPLRAAGCLTETRKCDPLKDGPFFCPEEIASDQATTFLEMLRRITDADLQNADIYLLHYFAGCTVSELAEILEKSEDDIDNHIVLADSHIVSSLSESHRS